MNLHDVGRVYICNLSFNHGFYAADAQYDNLRGMVLPWKQFACLHQMGASVSIQHGTVDRMIAISEVMG